LWWGFAVGAVGAVVRRGRPDFPIHGKILLVHFSLARAGCEPADAAMDGGRIGRASGAQRKTGTPRRTTAPVAEPPHRLEGDQLGG